MGAGVTGHRPALERAAPTSSTGALFQVGYVVPDLDAALDFFSERLPGPPFLVLRAPELEDETFHGVPFHPRQDLAFGYRGHLQVELIAPTDGGDESSYTQFLDRNPRGGVHHTAARVESLHQGVRDLGLEPDAFVQTGRFGPATRFGYVDLTDPTGALFELIELDEGGVGMFEALRRGEIGG